MTPFSCVISPILTTHFLSLHHVSVRCTPCMCALLWPWRLNTEQQGEDMSVVIALCHISLWSYLELGGDSGHLLDHSVHDSRVSWSPTRPHFLTDLDENEMLVCKGTDTCQHQSRPQLWGRLTLIQVPETKTTVTSLTVNYSSVLISPYIYTEILNIKSSYCYNFVQTMNMAPPF